jgi:hypothetical protein
MITINTYIFLSIIGITIMSMFLNIYSTIKVFNLIDERERHQEEVDASRTTLKHLTKGTGVI